MLVTPLHTPDDRRWESEQDYSPLVASALRNAYLNIRTSPALVNNYLQALTSIGPIIQMRMSPHQRLQVLFVLAMIYAGEEEYADSAQQLDEALDLAVALHEFAATAELFYLRGAVLKNLSRVEESATDHRTCLDILHSLSHGDNPIDPSFELITLAVLAGSEFLLAHYDASARSLEEARTLVPLAPYNRLEAADLAWIQALLHRWTGSPERALRLALAASEIYEEIGSPISQGRLQIIVTEIAMDLAEAFPDRSSTSARHAFTSLAKPYLHRAQKLAKETYDKAGEGLALLAHTRYSRILGLNESRVSDIESVIRNANGLGDIALLSQAYTALGDELTNNGEEESALNCYRQTLSLLANSGIAALGTWAHRRLLRANEMGTTRSDIPSGPTSL